MKATTVAAAAVLVGSVAAESWSQWSGDSSSDPVKTPTLDKTTSKPIEIVSTTSAQESATWSEWTSSSTPVKDTTSKSEDPSTWSEWESTSSSTPVKITSTSSADPHTWSEWESTSSTPVKSTTTDPANTWSEWESQSSSTPIKITSTDPATTWSAWVGTETITSTSTNWITVTVHHNDVGQTWSEWSSDPSVKTTSAPGTAVVSSTITKSVSSSAVSSAVTSSAAVSSDWNAWSADPATPLASVVNGCKMQISVSYGPPVWYPTPVIATAENTTTWGEWNTATSSTPAKITSTSSADPSTWAVWSSTSSTPVKVSSSVSIDPTWTAWNNVASSSSSADPSTWAVWSSTTSSAPVKSTSASSSSVDPTWSAWNSASSSSSSVDPTWSAWNSASSSSSSVDPTWSAWNSASSSSSSADPSTWAVWQSSTTSKPSVPTSSSMSVDPSTWSAWSQSEASKSSTASQSASSTGSAGDAWATSGAGISANGNKFGMTYTPYMANEDCKDEATVTSDIAKIAAKGFTSVRVYSTDCNTLEYVGKAARQHNMKIILGVFISETGITGAQPQVEKISQWAQWDLVELIVIGNEAVFNNRCSASELAGFIGSAKKSFKAAGYNGAVSTTDELSIWQSQGSAWCDTVDVVTANLYAFFNPNTKPEDAGDFINRQIEDLSKVCPGKDVYVMESGWPSAGECNGVACPSPENQAIAIKGIQKAVGAKVVFFSFEDEQWKKPGQFGVEQHWGCGEVFA